jgi:hypothetical protein
VFLPLLHRLWAGMAKVKVAGKQNRLMHAISSNGCDDYNNKSCELARTSSRRRGSMAQNRSCEARILDLFAVTRAI